MKSSALRWYDLRWPREVTPEQVLHMARLLATTSGWPVVVEAIGSPGRVTHRLAIPAVRTESVIDQLRAALPGLSLEGLDDRAPLPLRQAVELRLSTARRPLRTDDPASVSRPVLTALAQVHRGERLSLQWLLARSLPPTLVSPGTSFGPESWLGALLLAPFQAPRPLEAGERQAWLQKQAEPGWQVIGRIGVQAGSRSRARLLIGQVVGALASAQAPGVRFAMRPTNPQRLSHAAIGWRRPLRLNARELATVAAWPVGLTADLPVDKLGSRLVAPSAAIPKAGRVIGTASFPGRRRPLALSRGDSLRHLHVLGPTGVGKSTLLMNLVTQDMAAGRAVVVLDPKGDLITDLLARIPPERLADVVLLDPTDTERPVGLNPLYLAGRSPELVADQVLGMFHSLYAAHWGPRTHDILGASLLTLARTPGMTLAAVPLLLTNAGFRRRVVPSVSDPLTLAPFWQSYEAWSEAERNAAIGPVMNKLRPLLMRPELRAIVGQARPRFDLRQVFTGRKLLLVNLATGQLGPEASSLLGSLVVSQLWQAILGRSAIPSVRRHPVSVVLDEFQTYLHLPVDLADALAQARGLGAGFTLAHQFLHQLDPSMRSAVLANAQNRVAFRLPSEDARLLAAGSSLAVEDFQSLGAFECYAQLVVNDAIQPWCSLRTLPPYTAISDPAVVRAASRASYGLDRQQVEAELTRLVGGSKSDGNDLTPRRRTKDSRHE